MPQNDLACQWARLDGDSDTDQTDITLFLRSLTGPGIPVSPGCEGKDFDHDNDVDQSDFAIFQRCLSGEDVSANPNCAN